MPSTATPRMNRDGQVSKQRFKFAHSENSLNLQLHPGPPFVFSGWSSSCFEREHVTAFSLSSRFASTNSHALLLAMAAVANPSTLFERTMENLDLPKSDLNKLVMDYLITEGYPSAAERFAMEANIELNTDQSYIRERVNIRDLIHQGDIQQAIESINDLDSELLDKDKKLHFSLLRLQLVEMIKQSFINSDQALIGTAIEFAQQNLAPYTPLDASFKNDLERAMALLIIPRETWQNPQAAGDFGALAELVHPDLRRKTAENVNMSILSSQGLRKEPNIIYLVKARAWSEAQAREKKISLPERFGLGLEGDGSRQSGNGHSNDDTEMAENGSAAGSTGENDITRYTNIPP